MKLKMNSITNEITDSVGCLLPYVLKAHNFMVAMDTALYSCYLQDIIFNAATTTTTLQF